MTLLPGFVFDLLGEVGRNLETGIGKYLLMYALNIE